MTNEKLNVKLITSKVQATRKEAAHEVTFWLLSLPNGESVSCKTIEDARECATRFGCGLIL